MIAADTGRASKVFVWAGSKDRWHRRAACVGLIRGTRQRRLFPQIVRLSNLLLGDEDDLVQKGLGWLLRETVKYNRPKAVPYLCQVRRRAPRLILRTACETLDATQRRRILAA